MLFISIQVSYSFTAKWNSSAFEMPAAVEKTNDFSCMVHQLQQGTSNFSEYSKFIEDQVWGFRITGGAEFGMPITVFHVRVCWEHVLAGFFSACVLLHLNLAFYLYFGNPCGGPFYMYTVERHTAKNILFIFSSVGICILEWSADIWRFWI